MIQQKPISCKACPGFSDFRTFGFVPASVLSPADTRFALFCEAPGETEAITSTPLTGATGQKMSEILALYGLTWENVIRDNVLRCRPDNNEYPLGEIRDKMEIYCRQYDTPIDTYNPNVVILCRHPTWALIKSPSEAFIVHDSIKKALRLYNKGYRPVIAMGDHAIELLFPKLERPYGQWMRSHFFVDWAQQGAPEYEALIAERSKPTMISFADLLKPPPDPDDVPF